MRLRPYIKSRDLPFIAGWIDNERSHALWCAGHYPYPLTAEAFHGFMEKTMEEWAVCAFTVTDDSGKPVGFFRYSVDPESDVGFLASMIVDDKLRGKGHGREVTQLALRYAFAFTGAKSVQLNVFEENTAAKRCYQQVGFVERSVKKLRVYGDSLWHMCNMTISRAELCPEL